MNLGTLDAEGDLLRIAATPDDDLDTAAGGTTHQAGHLVERESGHALIGDSDQQIAGQQPGALRRCVFIYLDYERLRILRSDTDADADVRVIAT